MGGHEAFWGWGWGGERQVRTGYWWGNLRKRDHLEEVGVEVRIILEQIFKKWAGGIDCFHLVQDMDRWIAFENAAMNLQFP
jgi:hypothetical protein